MIAPLRIMLKISSTGLWTVSSTLAWFQVLVSLFQVGGKKQVGSSPQNPWKLVVIAKLLYMVLKKIPFPLRTHGGHLRLGSHQARDDPLAGHRSPGEQGGGIGG